METLPNVWWVEWEGKTFLERKSLGKGMNVGDKRPTGQLDIEWDSLTQSMSILSIWWGVMEYKPERKNKVNGM